MKDFNQLTHQGCLRRWRQLAIAGLRQYDLKVTRLKLIAKDTNLIYRVDTEKDERFILRVAYPGWRTLEGLQSEVMWLAALAHDTHIQVPRIIPTRMGESIVIESLPGLPQPQHLILMNYLAGRLLGGYLTVNNLTKLGTLFAELHQHGKSWQPPASFTTHRFDKVFSRGEADLLFDEEILPHYTKTQLKTMRTVRAKVDFAYTSLPADDLRIIHCDLWHNNLKVHQGELLPFDFEDTVWGYRLHDIAMSMLDLLDDTDPERYAQLLTAFKAGYTAHLSWPDGELGVLQMGRILWIINWVMHHHPQYTPQTLEKHIPRLETYLKTGQLV